MLYIKNRQVRRRQLETNYNVRVTILLSNTIIDKGRHPILSTPHLFVQNTFGHNFK
eukprot:Pgem_evm1s2418